jgi:hypothetical protein
VGVQTFELPETDGVLVTGRILPAGNTFYDVLKIAVKKKVPKLAATVADTHILLLEDVGTAIGFAKIGEGLDLCLKVFPELGKIDAVYRPF